MYKTNFLPFILVFFLSVPTFSIAQTFTIKNLQVDYMSQPLGIDVTVPAFSWEMESERNERGIRQKAYQILVQNDKDKEVWDSGKIDSAVSNQIFYKGEALEPTTRYTWHVKVWDELGNEVSTNSWFETGLLNPDIQAWDEATWIGGGNEDLVFYSHYLSVFRLEYALQLDEKSSSTKAAFVFGANDRRLMKKDLNIQGVENKTNESYIAFQLDISGLKDPSGAASFNIFRVGYDPRDSDAKPLISISVPKDLINNTNKYEKHQVFVESNFGLFEIYLNGREEENKISKFGPDTSSFESPGIDLNPIGRGHNYISFPMIADIGFKVEPGQQAIFSGLKISNYRSPMNPLFAETPGPDYAGIFSEFSSVEVEVSKNGYNLNGSSDGLLVVADPSKNSTPMLRTKFQTNKNGGSIQKARLYVTARGIYEMYINGERVSNNYFSPGLTQYNKTHMYQTYDVTDLIKGNSNNVMGAWLSEGWWSGNITYSGENWNYFGDRQSLLSKLVITYENGDEQVIKTTPENWKYYNEGPIVYGSFFQGEVYDSSKEAAIEGWATANYDDSQWKPAEEILLENRAFLLKDAESFNREAEFNYHDLKIIGQIGENPSIVKTLVAQGVEEVRPQVFVYDMGQNMVGFPSILIKGGKRGDTITLRYSEVKYPDLEEYSENVNMIMLENIRGALTQDIVILKGGDQVIQPRFTFHGYRFLEITGIKKALAIEDVKGMVISSVKELSSKYETSNELVNKLWENITWSMRGNFLSIPTDTPARNERMGWGGDISVFSRTATYMADVEPFLRRHLIAMRDIQREDGRFPDVAPVGGGFGGTLWGSAGIIVPWEMHRQYGDIKVLEEHYESMKDYMAFLTTKEDPETGILNEGPLGDWLSPEGFKNDNTMLWNAYQVYCLDILSNTANILGKTEDSEKFRQEYKTRKEFLNKLYIDQKTGRTIHSGTLAFSFGPPLPPEERPGKGDLVDTQASYAIPLALGVLDEKFVESAGRHLSEAINRKNIDELGVMRPEYSLMTGFIGTASIAEALSKSGNDTDAYRLLQQTSYPSWLYSVQNGATTIWERLNSYTVEDGFGGNNSMNSFNHYSFGAIAAWMYNNSLGIQVDKPGFKEFILQPTPDPDKKMTWAKGYYDSVYGRIESEWKLNDNGNTEYRFTVPANTSAILYLIAPSEKVVEESGKKLNKATGVTFLAKEDNRLKIKLGSGKYQFIVKQK